MKIKKKILSLNVLSRRAYIILIFAFVVPNPVFSQKAAKKIVHVVLFGGQSNALGWGYQQYLEDINSPLATPQTDVELFYSIAGTGYLPEETLLPLQSGSSNTNVKPLPNLYPMLTVAPISRFGPELSFARTVADRLNKPGEKVVVIKFSHGGSSLWDKDDWVADGTANAEADGGLYRNFQKIARRGLEAIKKKYPGYKIDIEGMGWVQGESDALENKGEEYQKNLETFITDIRATFGSDIPFVLNKISPQQIEGGNPKAVQQWEIVRKAQDFVAAKMSRVAATETLGINYAVAKGLTEGQYHYTTPALLQIGSDLGNALADISKWKRPSIKSAKDGPRSEKKIKAEAKNIDKKVYVILFGGQSNALGWGYQQYLEDAGDPLAKPQTDVEMFYSIAGTGFLPENTLLPLQSGTSNTNVKPLPNHYPALTVAPISRFGPELSFAKTVRGRITTPGSKVVVIKFAHGGTSLYKDWRPDGTADSLNDGNMYRIFQRVVWNGLAAVKHKYPGYAVEILGMGWLHGGSDADARKGSEYQENLTRFIADIRATFGADIVFALAKYSPNQGKDTKDKILIAEREKIRTAQEAVGAAVPNVVTTETVGLKYPVSIGLTEGSLHFTTPALLQIGRDLGEALVSAARIHNVVGKEPLQKKK